MLKIGRMQGRIQELLGEECTEKMKHENRPPLPDDSDTLLAEVESLKKQIYHLQMKRAILEKAVEIIKRAHGINPRELANAEKTRLIDALREVFPLKELLKKQLLLSTESSSLAR